MPRRGEGVVRDEHLVSGADAEREQRQVQTGRAVVDRDGVSDATVSRKRFLQRTRAGPLAGNPARTERLVDGLQLRRTERRETERYVTDLALHAQLPPYRIDAAVD